MSNSQTNLVTNELGGVWIPIPVSFMLHEPAFSNSALRLLITLQHFRNSETHAAWPGYKKISEFAGMHRCQIPVAIKELVDAGWLIVQKRPGTSNLYKIIYPATLVKDLSGEIGVSGKTGIPGGTTDTLGGNTDWGRRNIRLGESGKPTQSRTNIKRNNQTEYPRALPAVSIDEDEIDPDIEIAYG